jgi:AAA+ ATPase superfamily predicted ATPase
MNFVGREKELKALGGVLKTPGFCGAVVYGRRRLGKTSLIREAIKSYSGKVIFYQCLNTRVESENVRGLLDVVRFVLPDLLLSDNSSFMEVLKALFIVARKEPICLVLDEYPYLRNGAGTDSMIQSLIDEYKEESSLKLILCGSYVGIMEEVVDSSHPLYGRMSLLLRVLPFDYYDTSLMLPTASNDDKIRYYAVFGGTPYYLEKIKPDEDFESNVKNQILREFAPLESEILGGIRTEYSKIKNASLVMDLMASGKEKYLDLKKKFCQNTQADFDYLLKTLLDMGLVTKTGTLDAPDKKNFYGFGDNLYDFFFTCVHPNLQFRDLLPLDAYFSTYIKPVLEEQYLSRQFEKICREFLVRRNRLCLNNPLFTAIGRYVYNDKNTHTNGEFDIVTKDPQGLIFYECKYWKKPVDETVIRQEREQLKACGLKAYRLGFFSRSGFDKSIVDSTDLFYSQDDLFCF